MTAPVACCPRDETPLVLTFQMPGKEFYCMTCGRWWEFLQPTGKPETPELLARVQELTLNFRDGIRFPCDNPSFAQLHCHD